MTWKEFKELVDSDPYTLDDMEINYITVDFRENPDLEVEVLVEDDETLSIGN